MQKVVFIIVSVIVVIILLIIAVSMTATSLFNNKADNEIEEFLNSQGAVEPTIIMATDIKHLPISVQKRMGTSVVIGNDRIHTVRSK